MPPSGTQRSPQPAPLLARRLLIVTGKGGTGKTAVAASLALAAARRGARVLLAEVGREEQGPGLIAPGTGEVGYAGRELTPGLRAMRVEPYAALAEYLGLQLGGQRIARAVVANHGFRQLMAAAPGWRELITLGTLWHVEQQTDGGRPAIDLIVVDAPATGHGLTFLDVPRLVASAVRSGPLRRNAEEVERLLADPERTLLLPVALAEELPVRETRELLERLRGDLGIPVDRVVVNALEPRPLPPAFEHLPERLASLATAPNGSLQPATVAACVHHCSARYELQQQYLQQLGRETGLPLVTLPLLGGGVTGPDDLEALAEPLLVEPAPAVA